jgi:hypothetical protein
MKRAELDAFVAHHGLSRSDVEATLELAAARPAVGELRTALIRMLQLAGLLSLAAGIIFFIAANWSLFAVFGRFALLEVLLAACVGLALWQPPVEGVLVFSRENSSNWLALWPLLAVGAALFAAVCALRLRSHALLGVALAGALLHVLNFYFALSVSLLMKSCIMIVVGLLLVWQQSFTGSYNLREGMDVRIYRSKWGASYRLSAQGLNGFIQVERIR